MKPWPIDRSSASEAPTPFIFQLPATSGRIPGVIVISSGPFERALPTKIRPQSNRHMQPNGAIALPSTRSRTTREITDHFMLESLRTAAGTWVAKLLLLLLVLSFAVWGISGQLGGGLGGNAVISAGGTSVSVNEYRLAYDRQINQLSQRFGQRLTREQATALGVDNHVLAQLVVRRRARRTGPRARPRPFEGQDRRAHAEDPAFHGPDGKFDRQQFEYVLREVGMRPEDYLGNRAQEAIRQQIVEAVADGMKAPDTFLRAVALYRGEDRTAEYIALPKSMVEPIEPPGDAVLSTWFEENKKHYAAPEYRKIAYVKLAPEDIADESAITDDQVRADYEKNKARYTTPETRTIEQLVFLAAGAAEAALDTLNSGTTFDKIVEAEGKTMADVLLGTLAKDRIADKAVAEAAFALPLNEVSEVVEGAFGPVLVRVTAINPEVVRPLDEAAPEIRKDLALGEAHRILLDVHDTYEDARAAGETLAEAAAKLKLKVVTVDAIDQAGQRPDETHRQRPAGIAANCCAPPSTPKSASRTRPINIGSNGFVFFEVQGVHACPRPHAG